MNGSKKIVKWLIDKNLFIEYEDKLISTIIECGSEVYLYERNYKESFSDYVKNNFNQDDIIVFYGSLQHSIQISKMPVYPAVFLNIDNYECYNYYSYYGEYLLNNKYLLFGYNDIKRNINNIKTYFNNSDKVFIRSSDGIKSIPGQIINLNHIPNLNNVLTLISDVKNITDEYRFVVIDGKLITGCKYLDIHNMKSLEPYYDKICDEQEVIDFANKMINLYHPDKAFTIDICRCENELKILEINSFNSASLYGCDLKLIVTSINQLSIKEYDELFNI